VSKSGAFFSYGDVRLGKAGRMPAVLETASRSCQEAERQIRASAAARATSKGAIEPSFIEGLFSGQELNGMLKLRLGGLGFCLLCSIEGRAWPG